MRGSQTGEWRDIAISHLDALYGFAMRLTRDRDRAEDLVQETYAHAVPHLARLEPDSNIKAWLFTILRNAWLKELRHARSGPQFVAIDEDNEPASIAEASDPVILYERIWQRDELRAALEETPEHCAEIIILFDIEGFSYKETAEILGCPIGTVMSRLSRARAKLRRVLEKRLESAANELASGEG